MFFMLLCLLPERSTVNGAQSMFGDSPMNISHDVWLKQIISSHGIFQNFR